MKDEKKTIMYNNCCPTDQRPFVIYLRIKQHQMYNYIIKKHCHLVSYYFNNIEFRVFTTPSHPSVFLFIEY